MKNLPLDATCKIGLRLLTFKNNDENLQGSKGPTTAVWAIKLNSSEGVGPVNFGKGKLRPSMTIA